jgi:hypothetical protein
LQYPVVVPIDASSSPLGAIETRPRKRDDAFISKPAALRAWRLSSVNKSIGLLAALAILLEPAESIVSNPRVLSNLQKIADFSLDTSITSANIPLLDAA